MYRRSVRNICLKAHATLVVTVNRYESGDHVAVYPVNDSEVVEAIGTRLGVDLGTCFTVTNVDGRARR